jgi:hypothetical protein
VPSEWLEEAERLAAKMARPGMTSTRSDVLRAAIAKGLDALRAEVDGDDPRRPTRPKEATKKR